MKSHSWTAKQDLWVANILNNKREGYFVDAGASDGVNGSNTLMLERDLGWSGICCEPNPKFFHQLQSERNCHTFKAALSEKEEVLTFITAGFYGAAVEHQKKIGRSDEFIHGNKLYKKDYDGSDSSVIEVQGVRLELLLDIVGAPREIDYLSLDLEGGELQVLKTFPFHRYKFRCATIETHFTAHDGAIHSHVYCEEVRAIMNKAGYSLVDTRVGDDFFVHCSEV